MGSGDSADGPLPMSPPEVVPASVPGEPALPLIRPLAFGTRLASLLVPGEVIVEPPLVAPPPAPKPEPGEALGLDDSLACACWLQASKSACVCAATCAGAQTRTAAIPRSAVARVKLAMKTSSRTSGAFKASATERESRCCLAALGRPGYADASASGSRPREWRNWQTRWT